MWRSLAILPFTTWCQPTPEHYMMNQLRQSVFLQHYAGMSVMLLTKCFKYIQTKKNKNHLTWFYHLQQLVNMILNSGHLQYLNSVGAGKKRVQQAVLPSQIPSLFVYLFYVLFIYLDWHSPPL